MPHVVVEEDVTASDERLSLASDVLALAQPRHGEAPADSRTGASAEDALGQAQQEILALLQGWVSPAQFSLQFTVLIAGGTRSGDKKLRFKLEISPFCNQGRRGADTAQFL